MGLLDNLRWERFKNDSAFTVPPWGLMVVKDTVLLDGEIVHVCDRPSTTLYPSYMVNGFRAVDAGKYGDCTNSSPCLIAYDTGTPVNKEGYGLKPGQFTASIGYPGPRILGISEATPKLAYAELLPIVQMIGQSTGISVGATTAYTIRVGTAGSESDSTYVPPSAYAGAPIASGIRCLVLWVNNKWEITPLAC